MVRRRGLQRLGLFLVGVAVLVRGAAAEPASGQLPVLKPPSAVTYTYTTFSQVVVSSQPLAETTEYCKVIHSEATCNADHTTRFCTTWWCQDGTQWTNCHDDPRVPCDPDGETYLTILDEFNRPVRSFPIFPQDERIR